MNRFILLVIALCILSFTPKAQTEKRWIKHRITTLSGDGMHGRGYVNKGGEKAAGYIRRNFIEFGILPFDKDSTYYQKHFFGINTFPGKLSLKVNRKTLKPGADYLVHAASSPYHTDTKVNLKRINLASVKDSTAWAQVKARFEPGKSYFLKNADTVNKYLKFSIRSFAKELPKNLFVVSKPGKLTWTANQDTVPATIFYVEDSVLPKRPRKALATVETKYISSFASQNVLGYVRGTEYPDSFVVFTAHYDHLGEMGKGTIFPGAHDNASGTSLVLYLASYFAQHPQKYSIAFMLFSGEEAGLLGSKYYVSNPVFPLDNIRFVVNLDMTGDATNGITVVNGNDNPEEFKLMERINTKKSYLPKINQREQTQNSDHYSFSKEGVPAVFIYGHGTKGYYHDIFDEAKQLSLENIDGLAKLLIYFTGAL